jgi:HEPN domain-containing protein
VEGNKLNTLKGWVDKASNHLDIARESLKSYYRVSEAVQASQVCVELSVKAILTLLNIPFEPSHGWTRKQLAEIAKHINERGLLARLESQNHHYTVPLPRLLIRMNLWNHFYIEAKYGFEAGHLAPAQELFEKEDAELAVRHAEGCLRAAQRILHLSEDQIEELLGRQVAPAA